MLGRYNLAYRGCTSIRCTPYSQLADLNTICFHIGRNLPLPRNINSARVNGKAAIGSHYRNHVLSY